MFPGGALPRTGLKLWKKKLVRASLIVAIFADSLKTATRWWGLNLQVGSN